MQCAREPPAHPTQQIATALGSVGPRLRKVREQRGVTLTDVAARTGISKSTLSRLENGQRKPSLELLLPLAQVYRVPLDDLVGAPEVGDPRIRLKPRRVNGRTVLPLTHPGGVQAWKIVIPKSQSKPAPRTHDGYEWLYVLSGEMRLIQGEQDLVLGVGEAAEFDTQVPHWFGSTGARPGRGAEHLRPARGADAGALRPAVRTRRGGRAALNAGRVTRGPTLVPTQSPEGAVMATALVETKLFLPQARRGLVDRPRLADAARVAAAAADAGLRAGRVREDHAAGLVARRGDATTRGSRGWPWTSPTATRSGSGPTC